jgi:hypothetical protein
MAAILPFVPQAGVSSRTDAGGEYACAGFRSAPHPDRLQAGLGCGRVVDVSRMVNRCRMNKEMNKER